MWFVEGFPYVKSLPPVFQVLVLRELAVSAPTFFFQQVQPFFDNIFYAVWDSKQAIREGAVSALRACLILTTQRETKEMQKPQWYKVCFLLLHQLYRSDGPDRISKHFAMTAIKLFCELYGILMEYLF